MSLRDSPLGELKVPLTWTAAIAVVVAIVAVVAVLVSDRRETFRSEAYGATRGAVDTVLTPLGDVLSAPGRWTGAGVDEVKGYFFAVSENHRLNAELKEMRQWRDVALALRNENARYRTLLGLKTDPPIPMVAARIVLDSRGPFAATRLANAGKEDGVKVGNPVMSENGLVGRVIGVTTGASRVLLVTDTASKIPVMIDRTNARAILTGDGGPNPKLDYLRGENAVKEGDRIMTSGDGGVMPRGLPVGTAVKGLDGRWRVVLAADKAPMDFVRILLFEDFTQLVNQKELAEKSVPPPTVGALTVGPTPIPLPPPAGKPAAGATVPTAPSAAGAGTAATAPAAPSSAKAPEAKPAAAANPKPATTAAKPGELSAEHHAGAATTKPTTTAPKPAAAKPGAPKSPTAKTPSAKPATAKPVTAKPAAPKPVAKKPEAEPPPAEEPPV